MTSQKLRMAKDTPRQEHADRSERKLDRCRVLFLQTMLTLTCLCFARTSVEQLDWLRGRLLDQRTRRHCTWQMQRMRQNLRSPLLPACGRTKAATTISDGSSSKKPDSPIIFQSGPSCMGGWVEVQERPPLGVRMGLQVDSSHPDTCKGNGPGASGVSTVAPFR